MFKDLTLEKGKKMKHKDVSQRGWQFTFKVKLI